jgi:hypothetical protein
MYVVMGFRILNMNIVVFLGLPNILRISMCEES